MQALTLVRKGTRWRIWDGESVRIWWDRWIPTAADYRVQTQVSRLGITEKVSKLIDQDTRSWKSNLLQANFQPTYRDRINQIPIPFHPRADMRV
ncbi:unnamed protein product [Linum trigynum]|uniref:Uncharacterized protein n=1 Tax=Linum trigynum TaxID=586398 RepID=A0AAV2CD92_9ROSI